MLKDGLFKKEVTMAKNEVIGGDYKGYQIGSGWGGNVYLRSSPFSKPLDLTKENIKKVEIVTEENKKKVLGTLGGGIAGGLLLKPIGLFAGLLAGGNKRKFVSCAI